LSDVSDCLFSVFTDTVTKMEETVIETFCCESSSTASGWETEKIRR